MKFSNLIYISLLSLPLLFASCEENFLDGEKSDVATQAEIDKMILENPEKAKVFIGGGYELLYAPSAPQRGSHDDFGLAAIYLATDIMADDIAIPSPYFFRADYQNKNRFVDLRRPRSTWWQMYSVINQANLALAPLDNGTPVEELSEAHRYYLGQALALRGFCYSVLINLYQQPYSEGKSALGIPIYTVTETKIGRNPVGEVYQLIISDLTRSYEILKGLGKPDNNDLNEFAVAAILARTLCFVNDYPNQWSEVAMYADIAASGSQLMTGAELTSGLNSIASKEVLWGAAVTNETSLYYATLMSHIDPYQNGYAGIGGYMHIASDLYNKIDHVNDIRSKWFFEADTNVGGKTVPKYTIRKFRDKPARGFTADYIHLRTAEMHFLKAEALFLKGDEPGAKTALTAVMTTRNPVYATTKTGAALLDEIRIQKRIEMIGEGCRLMDIKWRKETMDRRASTNHRQDYTPLTLPFNAKQYVFQIPQLEMDTNEEITDQNPNP